MIIHSDNNYSFRDIMEFDILFNLDHLVIRILSNNKQYRNFIIRGINHI